ncbi:MAG: SLBB domain-containing protein, partial [Verrucomicrobiota bacterium]
LTFGLQGRPEVTRSNVVIPPDGKVSFMQARQVSAAGKTIDELRAALEARLAEFQKDPVAIVTPVALSSKQFSVLGEVRNSGNYPLTRHTTLLEALSLAGGFNLGLLETGNNVFEVADLKRSFVSRNGIKLGVDLEALYLRGDFSQNIQLEPGDYIHIASLEENQVFVLGRVNRPGAYPARPGVTALGAIAESGGFSQGAWRNRVLVVRGKLSDPTLHVVQLNKTIRGKNSDFSLEPGDLVYVSLRPWAYATQILDAALAAYIDGSVTGLLANDDVGFSFGPGF